MTQPFPAQCNVPGPNQVTLNFFKQEVLSKNPAPNVAEIGVYKGDTTLELAHIMDNKGTIYLFDFRDRIIDLTAKLTEKGYANYVSFGNSRRYFDSYNWELARLLNASKVPLFDYVFIDGAHSWAHDALAFFLCDLLLKPGGYIDFDDYGWSFGMSATMSPTVFPAIEDLYTEEQIEISNVAMVVDLLVKRNVQYKEIVYNKIFQKVE